jgi:chitinase
MKCKTGFWFLAAAFVSSTSVQAQDLKAAWAPQVTDCTAFFGVWAQSDSSSADTYKAMNGALLTYSKLVHGSAEAEVELTKSRRKMASMLHQARKADSDGGDADSKQAVSKQVSLCLATLKKAEQELWPRLSTLQKQETPKLSK